MNVQFYSFSKRRNSTKQPSGSGTIIDCKLKEGTSVKNPKLQISGRTFGYNYAYIPDFGRYYFVNDIISESYDITTYVLEEDSLASNKTAIGSTVARIGYSSTGYNVWIPDTRISVEQDKTVTAVSTPTDFSSVGCYILSCLSDNLVSSHGIATSFLLDLGDMTRLHQPLVDPGFMQRLFNSVKGNLIDTLFGCIFVPFDINKCPVSGSGNLHVANEDTGISVSVVNGTGLYSANTYYITIPHRYNDFRDYEPYTTAQLYLPGVGCVDLCLADYQGATQIAIQCVFEYGTGDVTYFLSPDTAGSKIVQTFTVNCASQCPLGQTTSNTGSALTGAIGTVASGAAAIAGIASGGAGTAVAATGSLLMNAANTALQANRRGASLKGGIGGRTDSLYTSITLVVFANDTENCAAANYIAQRGRPVAATHSINNHSGYVQCDDASVSITGDAWERDQINSYLNSGFFYE